ncbi:MAG TPA: hypothetical protein PK733_09240 [Clostridiales bacterium]|nr:hypothetical protein [Clostridiales bacterium]
MRYRKIFVIFWPFVAIWNLIELILRITGRLVAVILGLVLMIVGVALCFTVVGAVAGIPLAAFGFTMMIRGFF